MSKFKVELTSTDEGETRIKATYQGNPCDLKVINESIGNRRRSLELILNDILQSHEYLCLLEGAEGSSLAKPLYKAFVVTYGKCFSTGKERGLSLDARDVFKESKANHEVHDLVMKTRNKYIAHSDSSGYESSEIYLASYSNHSEILAYVQKYSHPVEFSLEKEKNLCLYVHKVIERKILKEDQHLIKSLASVANGTA